MKNLFYLLVISALIFSSCSKVPPSSSQLDISDNVPIYSEENSSNYSSESIATPLETTTEPPIFEASPNSFPLIDDSYGSGYPYSSFRYASVEEFIKVISTGSDGILEEHLIKEGLMKKEYIKGSVINIKKDRSLYWEITDSFITNRITQNNIHVPFLNNKMYDCELAKGNITFFPTELYNRSWIWYKYDNTSTIIAVMYLDTVLNSTDIKTANDRGISWLINKINPNGENSEKQYPLYDESYIKEIHLFDRKVDALWGLQKTEYESDIYKTYFYFFVYDDVLIKIQSNKTDATEEWLKSLSFKPVPLK